MSADFLQRIKLLERQMAEVQQKIARYEQSTHDFDEGPRVGEQESVVMPVKRGPGRPRKDAVNG